MYSEWSSLVDEIRQISSLDNVLSAYPAHASKEMVSITLKSLNDAPRAKELPMSLKTSEEVKWTMEVISHGLALPLAEYKLIHACIDVYERWLTALVDPKKSVPQPLKDTPNVYAPIIFRQLSQVFVRRKDQGVGLASSTQQLQLDNQAILCERVLATIHNMMLNYSKTKISRETWDCLLMCLLRTTDIILSPSPEPGSIAAALKALPVHTLFEAWLRASISCFPRPQFWKSLLELCVRWRHHGCLANQWTRLTYTLTYQVRGQGSKVAGSGSDSIGWCVGFKGGLLCTLQVIGHLYKTEYLGNIEPSGTRLDADFKRIVSDMPYDVLVQCWYRVLHALGNPVELAYPKIMARLPAFQSGAEGREGSLSRAKHQQHHHHQARPPQLTALPRIYHELMRGVATLVYLFLREDVGWNEWDEVDGHGGPSDLDRRDSGGGKQGQGLWEGLGGGEEYN